MGLLSIILGVAAIAGAVFTGGSSLALLAGGFALASAAAQQGWLGGGMKNFFNSSIGKDLTLAASVASIGSSVSSIATAPSQAALSADETAANAAGSGAINDLSTSATASLDQTANATLNQAAQTPNQFLTSTLDPTGSVASFSGSAANDAEMAPGAASAQATQQANTSASASNTTAATNEGATQQAVGQAASGTPQANTPTAQTGAAANSSITPGSNPAADFDNANAQVNPTSTGVTGGNTAPPPSTAGTGMLGQVGSFLKNNPSAALMGGQALSGLAQGAMQQKTMQEQIAAEQWASMRWTNPQLAASFQTANDGPINVPGGYLQRAAAVRSMVSGAGGQPQPGAQPSSAAPAAPVPVLGMGRTS